MNNLSTLLEEDGNGKYQQILDLVGKRKALYLSIWCSLPSELAVCLKNQKMHG